MANQKHSSKTETKSTARKEETMSVAKEVKDAAESSGVNNVVKLERASEKHTGAPINSAHPNAKVKGNKAYLPPIATRRKMLVFSTTLATKTTKRLKKWVGERAEFGKIASKIDEAIALLTSASIDLEKLPNQMWEPTRAVAAVNVGGFAVNDEVRIREKRQTQYADILGDKVAKTFKVKQVGKSKIVLDVGGGMATVVAKTHLIDSKTSLEDERAQQAKVDEARKAKKDGAATA
jgi:hypothetical protein